MANMKPVGTTAVTRMMRSMRIGRAEGLEKMVGLMGRILLEQELNPERGSALARRFREIFERHQDGHPELTLQRITDLEMNLLRGAA